MPFYFDINQAPTSNGTAATESDHLRLLTVANQMPCDIIGVYGGARFNTVGGGLLRVKTFATASTVGTAITPAKRNPNNPVAQTTAFTTPTAGATPTTRLSIGLAQAGGMGGWVALEEDHAIGLLSNGGAGGNADLFSIFNAAAVPFDYTLEFKEG